ncbi:hypothetical protein [Psychromonas sp. Urea-02u-13]|uniref:hypothetical protein n=1 Tax=Psychromonas sp. Urea-02u-13 TaxID=2058326 RepID=UPI000C31FCF6|nr:hypothetical protein [Psychromonas sp. Urea-02u-13]PKG37710.1 hypothetical protein CXF74_17395 [Psychromonas sp. Urea-02u-13]
MSKCYLFTAPDGKTHETTNLKEFAIKHDLPLHGLYKLNQGDVDHVKGWAKKELNQVEINVDDAQRMLDLLFKSVTGLTMPIKISRSKLVTDNDELVAVFEDMVNVATVKR